MNDTTTKWKPELYNEKHSFVYQYGESLIKLLDPKENQRILDLGCGSGQLTSKIFPLSFKMQVNSTIFYITAIYFKILNYI